MPRTNREYLLRYADQADNDMDRALSKLKALSDMYEPGHKLHHEFMNLIAIQLVTIQRQLKDFRYKHM